MKTRQRKLLRESWAVTLSNSTLFDFSLERTAKHIANPLMFSGQTFCSWVLAGSDGAGHCLGAPPGLEFKHFQEPSEMLPRS